MLQYNFKIDETLKLELEKALSESNSSSKSDFLANMLLAYQSQRVSNTPTDLDLTKYESVNQEAKDSIANAFKHILTLLDANSSTVKQEKIQVHDAHKVLEAKEEGYKSQLEQLEADTEERVSNAQNQAKELEIKGLELEETITALNQRLQTTSQIATQVQVITEENHELRTTVKLCEDHSKRQEIEASREIKQLKESNFKQDFALIQREKDYSTLETQLAEIKKSVEMTNKAQKKELTELNHLISVSDANLNQALGKLEILNTQKPK